MKTIRVDLKKRSYDIIIGTRAIDMLGRRISRLDIGSDAYVITNAKIKKIYGKITSRILSAAGFSVKFKSVADTEKSKSMETAYSVIKDMTRYDKKRRLLIVALGGGVIGDLAGFIASIYKRGIPYVQVPTTFLAQVDSSIGGKTAVDLEQAKNMLGVFYQPRLVLSDIGFLKTLSTRQLESGLGEVIKYAVIKDPGLFDYLEKRYRDVLARKKEALEFVVARCSSIKAGIVENDEKEELGLRTILNFGHTLGHAIEAAGGYRKYSHGEAVALGMILSCDISMAQGMLEPGTASRIERLIKAVGLPVRISGVAFNKIIKAHYRDKKFIGAKNRFVLIEDIGKTKIRENIPLSVIKEAVKSRSI